MRCQRGVSCVLPITMLALTPGRLTAHLECASCDLLHLGMAKLEVKTLWTKGVDWILPMISRCWQQTAGLYLSGPLVSSLSQNWTIWKEILHWFQVQGWGGSRWPAHISILLGGCQGLCSVLSHCHEPGCVLQLRTTHNFIALVRIDLTSLSPPMPNFA